MYHIYNLIAEGDEVRALAVRRVQTTSSTGSSDSYRVRVQLQISVTKTSFSQAASGSAAGPGGSGGGLASNGTSNDRKGEGTASLQISGRVVNENEYVRLGAFHTLDLEGKSSFGRQALAPSKWITTVLTLSQPRFPAVKSDRVGLCRTGADRRKYKRGPGSRAGRHRVR